MDEAHQRRIAHNEAMFRRLNEQAVAALDAFLGANSPELELVCECALGECNDMLRMTSRAYHAMRSEPTRFVVLPEHVLPGSERTVEQTEQYWVIEKVEAGADVAREAATQ